MNPTSLSLLDRLKAARPDASDRNRLHGLYLPLIERWLGRVTGLGDESADLAREILIFRDRFDAEPAFHLQKQSLDPFPETGR